MTIRFKRRHKQFNVGDLCNTYDAGVCDMLIVRGIAELVDDVKPKRIATAPADKMLKPKFVRNKSVATA